MTQTLRKEHWGQVVNSVYDRLLLNNELKAILYLCSPGSLPALIFEVYLSATTSVKTEGEKQFVFKFMDGFVGNAVGNTFGAH